MYDPAIATPVRSRYGDGRASWFLKQRGFPKRPTALGWGSVGTVLPAGAHSEPAPRPKNLAGDVARRILHPLPDARIDMRPLDPLPGVGSLPIAVGLHAQFQNELVVNGYAVAAYFGYLRLDLTRFVDHADMDANDAEPEALIEPDGP